MLFVDSGHTVYRASFCRTFAECENSATGEWKYIVSNTMVVVAMALWAFILMKKFGQPLVLIFVSDVLTDDSFVCKTSVWSYARVDD